jgi:hypothetical protein
VAFRRREEDRFQTRDELVAVISAPFATIATTRRLKFMRVLSPGVAYATMFVAVIPWLLILGYIARRIAS